MAPVAYRSVGCGEFDLRLGNGGHSQGDSWVIGKTMVSSIVRRVRKYRFIMTIMGSWNYMPQLQQDKWNVLGYWAVLKVL
ncbi:U2 putative protein [Porton virus]|uniref:U2 putative protein n=1 Tax=Porton virus TaxID=1272940 RepID=UPI002481FAF3|nr:U2 putative protein [Porton virus]UAX43313.1 U2 putative protein [Porton virus]